MKKDSRLVVITGFMGAGKTEVGGALARRLSAAMIDLDCLIEEREGRSPQMIIEEEGEARFRQLESEALGAALETLREGVIALGGGTWTVSSNRALLRERGALTVWLDAPFELCWRRIEEEDRLRGARGRRPLARDVERARLLYDERLTLYHQAGLHVRVHEEQPPDAIAEEIRAALSRADFEEKQ